MKVQLFDRGTPKGKQLFADLDNICQRLQVDFAPEYIKDMGKVYSLGIQGNTVLLINNEPVLIDQYPSPKELESILADFLK